MAHLTLTARNAVLAGAAALAVLLLAPTAPPPASADISCSDVSSDLGPCLPYVTHQGALSSACCDGVRTLNSAAATTADRGEACTCIKNFAGTIPRLDPDLAAGIPDKCGVKVGFPISPSTDCSKIN